MSRHDPGRALIMSVADAGLLTHAEAEALDTWASKLADEVVAGTITEAELQARIRARVAADIARRGSA